MPFTKHTGKICNNTVQTATVCDLIGKQEENQRPVGAILAGTGTLEQNIKSLGSPRAKKTCVRIRIVLLIIVILPMNGFLDIYNTSVMHDISCLEKTTPTRQTVPWKCLFTSFLMMALTTRFRAFKWNNIKKKWIPYLGFIQGRIFFSKPLIKDRKFNTFQPSSV